jgi:putative Mg2+ transporter-C (MgtC) family protein
VLPYLGDLHELFSRPVAGAILTAVSVCCGMIVGMERESQDKPAGLKTVTIICMGSTLFTLASILMTTDGRGDPSRIAAQVVTGVGFLGAGAIIREGGTVVGLTTGATIWAVAAIGMMVGAGYAAAGLLLSIVVMLLLSGLRWGEQIHDKQPRGKK